MTRVVILGVAALAVVLFFALDLDSRISFDALKASVSSLQEWRSGSPVAAAAIFFGIYVAVTGLSLPGATILTLAAGAMFGVVLGTLYVSFASSLGALLAFLASRYLFRDAIQKKFGERLKAVNGGVRREGAFYLFTLRLVPVFPFFLINLLMGLTPMRATTFYLVSQIGMLAGTLVYVNAGTQLAGIEAAVRHPDTRRCILSLRAARVVPAHRKRGLDAWRRHRVYAHWKQPARFDRNLVVIGAGASRPRHGLHRRGGQGQSDADRRPQDGRRLPELRLRAQQGADPVCQARAPDPARRTLRTIRRRPSLFVRTSHATGARRDQQDRAARLPERYTKSGRRRADRAGAHRRSLDSRGIARRRLDHASHDSRIVIAAGASAVVPPLPGIEDLGVPDIRHDVG